MSPSPLTLLLGVVFGALISEDAALLSAMALYQQGTVPLAEAFFASTLGIVAGDFGLYYVGRAADRALKTGLTPQKQGLQKWGLTGLFVARFIPGTRLPAYLGAGLFRVPLITFGTITVLSTTLWVGLTAYLLKHSMHQVQASWLWGIAAALLFITAINKVRAIDPRVTYYQVLRWRYFEFWPAWFFYIPVVAYYIYLGIRNRSFAYPLFTNPGIPNSGVIGESKTEILGLIPDRHPEKLASTLLKSNTESPTQSYELALRFIAEKRLNFPIILKPDVGQRGSGVSLVRSENELKQKLSELSYDAILQEYSALPEEIGVNYERLPSEPRGRITGITRKRFPSVQGDGKQTLRQLILNDSRARWIAPVYFNKHLANLNQVIPFDESYILAKIGNHCQGAIFENGASLLSPALENKIDEISRSMPGFFVGRFDLRFASESELQKNGSFRIIEINGAAGEATHIYDKNMSLAQAYSTLFGQLRFLFKLGQINLKDHPELKSSFWSDFFNYKKTQTRHANTT